MIDESSNVGAAAPSRPQPVARPSTDPVADKTARDAEFAAFYQPEFSRLVGFLMVQGAGHLAADIAQEAMTEAYRHWEMLDRPGAWVRIVAQRSWWKCAARGDTQVPRDDLPEPSGMLAPAAYEQIENRDLLRSLLRDLTDLQRQVLAWSYDGYHPTEIAVALSKAPSTVRSALREARKKVQTVYQQGGETR